MQAALAFIGRIVRRAGLLAFFAAPLPAAWAAVPDFKKLWENYPRGSDADVKKAIGGAVNADWITNTSTVRMSRAFNHAGAVIPANAPGLNTVAGGDKLRYAYRPAEFKAWMTSKYGQPTLSFKAGPYGNAPPALVGRQGIIAFVDAGWSDASGHLDLWDGQKVAGNEYFARAKQVYLWESAKPPAAVAREGKTTAATSVRAGPATSAQILGSLPKGTVVNLIGNGPTNNFWNIGNGRYVSASYVQVLAK